MATRHSSAAGRHRHGKTANQRKNIVTSTNDRVRSADAPGKGDDGARAMLAEQTGGASLDKVRDILFGVQMRDYERKIGRLEERLLKETESLAERIKAEHDERSDGAKDLARELKETGRAFDKKTAHLDDQLAKSQRELRQQMLDQYQRLAEEIRQKTEEVLMRLAQESQELRTEKTDRAALASLLTEMAMRLNNEFRLPGADDDRHG